MTVLLGNICEPYGSMNIDRCNNNMYNNYIGRNFIL